MDQVAELTRRDCEARLRSASLGRLAVSTPTGPFIAAVPYVVTDDAVVVRTTPYSMIGSHGRGAIVALEVDDLEGRGQQAGWSVLVRGRAEPVTDEAELRHLTMVDVGVTGGLGRRMHLRVRLATADVSGTSVTVPQPVWRLAAAPPA